MSKASKIKVSPIDYVIHHFHGVRPLGRELNVNPSTITRLRKKRDKAGNLGLIPGTLQKKILARAADRKLPITSDNVVNGGEIEKQRAARR